MFLTTTRRPLEVGDLHRRLNRVFDEVYRGWPFNEEGEGTVTASWAPPCDVFEDKENIRIVAEVPGVNPGDVKLSLENSTLTIRGEKKQVAEEKTERVHRYERAYGMFERTFSLPTTVDAERIQAQYENGILTVTLPKVERARPREIPVQVK